MTVKKQKTGLSPANVGSGAGEGSKEKGERTKPFKTALVGKIVVSSELDAKQLYEKSSFGELAEDRIQYSLVEALYLLSKGRIKVNSSGKGKETALDFTSFLKQSSKLEPNFYTRFIVFKDMRNRGYIVKTALKFGADFRVYNKGVKPGQDHARWILYPVSEGSTLTWQDFAAKNRVAHSTKKRLLIGVVDNEGDVTYYEISWQRP